MQLLCSYFSLHAQRKPFYPLKLLREGPSGEPEGTWGLCTVRNALSGRATIYPSASRAGRTRSRTPKMERGHSPVISLLSLAQRTSAAVLLELTPDRR
jgi:hypothetical protein